MKHMIELIDKDNIIKNRKINNQDRNFFFYLERLESAIFFYIIPSEEGKIKCAKETKEREDGVRLKFLGRAKCVISCRVATHKEMSDSGIRVRREDLAAR